MTDANMVLATVVGENGFFDQNAVLHQPGEQIWVDLNRLGIKSLDESKSLKASDANGEPISTMAVASVAPRAPGATMPQGLPSGTVQSGTGRFISPAGAGENAGSVEILPDTTEAELQPDPPIRRDTDIDADAMSEEPAKTATKKK